MRAVFQWSLGTRTLELGKRTLIMGVVNVTPDSFSDGGLYLESEEAVDHALRLLDEGADIIDVGGESTRPGTKIAVSAEEEVRRVLPVITALKKLRPAALISIDTHKAGTARAAEPYPIHVMVPLTGNAAFLGQGEQDAFVLAETLINESGGIKGRPVKFVSSINVDRGRRGEADPSRRGDSGSAEGSRRRASPETGRSRLADTTGDTW